MINSLNIFINKVLSPERVVFLLIFFCNSFVGWLCCTIQLLFQKNKRKQNLVFWSLLSVVFVSLYNATKVPDSDLIWYTEYYLMAGDYDLISYLAQLTGGKEPLYQMIVYFLHIVGGNNVHFFVFSISAISYVFLLRALFLWKLEADVSDLNFMFAVMTLCFFPWTFALSVHIIRQFLALSIMLWAFFSYHGSYKKRYLCFAISSVFIHSSVVIFVPLLFIKRIAQPIKLKYLYVMIGVVASFSSIKQLGTIAQHYVKNSATLAHIAQKAAEGTHFETSLPLSQFLFSVALVLFAFLSVYGINRRLKDVKFFTLFLNMSLILLFFIMASSNYSEIQLRYNFYFWSFVPFFVIIYLNAINFRSYIKFCCMFSLFLFWNGYNMFLSSWTYTCANEFFLYPFFWYFLD